MLKIAQEVSVGLQIFRHQHSVMRLLDAVAVLALAGSAHADL